MPGPSIDEHVLPVIEEEVHVEKRERVRARVTVAKTTSTEQQQIDVPLTEEHIEVERVAVGRVVTGPVAVRQEGDVTIVPVLEEVVVVEKRLVLKEELHIRKVRSVRHQRQTVDLRREHIEVNRINTEGDDE